MYKLLFCTFISIVYDGFPIKSYTHSTPLTHKLIFPDVSGTIFYKLDVLAIIQSTPWKCEILTVLFWAHYTKNPFYCTFCHLLLHISFSCTMHPIDRYIYIYMTLALYKSFTYLLTYLQKINEHHFLNSSIHFTN